MISHFVQRSGLLSIRNPCIFVILLHLDFLKKRHTHLGFFDEIDDLCYQTNTSAKDRKEGPLRGWFTAC